MSAYAEYLAWVAKLREWSARGGIEPPPGALEAATERLRVVVQAPDISPEQAEELVALYRTAFRLPPDTDPHEALMPPTRVDREALKGPSLASLPPLGEESFLTRYAAWLATQESPTQYHVYTALTVFSAQVRRRARYRIGGIDIYPNLYTVLVGPSGTRKDTALDYAMAVFGEASPVNILPSEGSPQGIVDNLSSRARMVGTSDGLFCAPELRVLFGNERYKESLVVWLTDWWKSPASWSRVLREGVISLDNVYVTVFGGTTMSWLKRMPIDFLTGGFLLGRALLIPAYDKKCWSWEPTLDEDTQSSLTAHVREALRYVPGVVEFSTEARERMRSWYEDTLPARYDVADERTRTFLQRAHVYAIKFATLISLLDHGSAQIPLAAVEKALLLTTWADEAMRPVVVELDCTETLPPDILAALRRHDGMLTKRRIIRLLRNKHRALDVRRTLDALEYDGTLRRVKMRGEEYYVLAAAAGQSG